jgi:hypothetical protein
MTTETSTRFIKIDDDWHLIADTYIENAMQYHAKTACGLDVVWDQTFVDRLPGGNETMDETVHAECREAIGAQLTGTQAEDEEPPKKKATAKAK